MNELKRLAELAKQFGRVKKYMSEMKIMWLLKYGTQKKAGLTKSYTLERLRNSYQWRNKCYLKYTETISG